MTQPLFETDPDFVWRSGFYDGYFVEVQRTGNWSGRLYIFHYDPKTQYSRLVMSLEEEVSLSFGARPDPDEMDIQNWQREMENFLYSVNCH